MKFTYNTFLVAWRGQIRQYLEVEVVMIYSKFIGTPTSRGHVQIPTWMFASFFLSPPQSPTNLLAVLLLYLLKWPWCLDDLTDAAPCPLYYPQLLQSHWTLCPSQTLPLHLHFLNLALVNWKFTVLFAYQFMISRTGSCCPQGMHVRWPCQPLDMKPDAFANRMLG